MNYPAELLSSNTSIAAEFENIFHVTMIVRIGVFIETYGDINVKSSVVLAIKPIKLY